MKKRNGFLLIEAAAAMLLFLLVLPILASALDRCVRISRQSIQRRKAFTLFEIVVYLGLVAAMLPLIFSALAMVVCRTRTLAKCEQRYLAQTCAFDVLKNDCRAADFNHAFKDEYGHLVWKVEHLDENIKPTHFYVSWFYDGEIVKRSRGFFDEKTRKWATRTTNDVCQASGFMLHIHPSNSPRGEGAVSVCIDGEKRTIESVRRIFE